MAIYSEKYRACHSVKCAFKHHCVIYVHTFFFTIKLLLDSIYITCIGYVPLVKAASNNSVSKRRYRSSPSTSKYIQKHYEACEISVA